jgi:hypothetical protein
MILSGSINVRQFENGSGGLMNGMQSYWLWAMSQRGCGVFSADLRDMCW